VASHSLRVAEAKLKRAIKAAVEGGNMPVPLDGLGVLIGCVAV